MRRIKTKLMLIATILVCIFYFTGDFSLIDIQKTAIIVAIGIDKTDNEFEVTAQIAIPQATDQSSQNNDALISAKGLTPFEAIDNIGIKTGWQPKLSFCDLIVFGDKVEDEQIFTFVDYALSSQKLQNSALLATCEGNSKDLLSKATALDAISAFAIQKILLKNTLKVNTVLKCSIREFAMNHYSPSNFAFMPKIKIEKGEGESDGNSSSSQMTSTAGGSADTKGSSPQGKNVIFNASTTAVYSHGKYVFDLDSDETLIASLIDKKVDESYIPVDIDEKTVLLSVTSNTTKKHVEFLEKPTYYLDVTLQTSITDGTKKISLSDVSQTSLVDEKILLACEEKTKQLLNGIKEKNEKFDTDFFQIKNKIYKFHYKHFKSIEKLNLNNFNFVVNTHCKSLD